jgi:hypothetical protein
LTLRLHSNRSASNHRKELPSDASRIHFYLFINPGGMAALTNRKRIACQKGYVNERKQRRKKNVLTAVDGFHRNV